MIKKARAKVAEEEDRVRNMPPDFMTPANAFETHVGHFWGILETRPYMRARYALAGQHLADMNTLDGVQEALDHLRDMLRLCRGDNMGVRDRIPSLMLRLDFDQECYDFVKWWATVAHDSHYDWGDTDLPYLDIHCADVFEDPDFIADFAGLNHVVALILIKLKLLIDIRNLNITRKVTASRGLPVELRDLIELAVIRSPLSIKLQKATPKGLAKIEKKLMDQICRLGRTLTQTNEHFMFNLFEPDEALSALPDVYSRGSWEEMALVMQSSYTAFWETEGVLDLLTDARACAARDSADEIEDFMEDELATARAQSRPPRTPKEILEDISVNRIWGYLDYAVENASYLGPWSERPSERHRQENRAAWDMADDEDAEWIIGSDRECLHLRC